MTPHSEEVFGSVCILCHGVSIYNLVPCFKFATLLFLHDKRRTTLLILYIIPFFFVKSNYFLCNVVVQFKCFDFCFNISNFIRVVIR